MKAPLATSSIVVMRAAATSWAWLGRSQRTAWPLMISTCLQNS
jgi:hypothetical protein